MKVLVTGGAGFIGSNLVSALLAHGHAVRVLDDLSTGRRENLADVVPQVELRVGCVRDLQCVREAMRGVDGVLHQAALPSVQRSLEDPVASHRTNVDGTLNVLLAARDEGVRRVVYASSSSVYGNSGLLPKREEHPPAPASPYAVAKLTGEHYARVFFQCFGLETVALRYFNVFGPRQDPDSHYAAVIPRFIRALLRREAPVIFGDGGQTRDFTFVANVVDANLRALETPGVGGGVFNVATGQRVSLLALLEALGRHLGVRAQAQHLPPRGGEVRDSLAAIEAAQGALGYTPRVSFEEGLARTVDWYRRHLSA